MFRTMGQRLGLAAALLLVGVAALWSATRGPPSSSSPPEVPRPPAAQQLEAEPHPDQAHAKAETASEQAPKPSPADAAATTEAVELPAGVSTSGLPAEHKPASMEPDSWDGDWLTQRAMDKPNMAALSPGDPAYDAVIEARQQFHTFEMELQALQPLEPNSYREALGRHKKSNAAALRRVGELRRAGHPDAASKLYKEWSRLFDLYRRRAYRDQRSDPPPPAEAPR